MAKKRKTALGERLRRLRAQRGLTQTEAAEKVGVTLRAWQSWEHGHRRTNKGHLKLIQLLDDGTI